jgi:chaperonin GroES
MIKPLNNNVVLRKEKKELEEKTASGIILSQKKDEESEYAVVVEVGEGKYNNQGNLIKPNVKKGDKVIYKSYSPTKVKVDGVEYLIVSADDILAVLD